MNEEYAEVERENALAAIHSHDKEWDGPDYEALDEDLRREAIDTVRDLILKYTLPDALKPEYDGMTAWAFAQMIVDSVASKIQR